jgi:hypothetical protein
VGTFWFILAKMHFNTSWICIIDSTNATIPFLVALKIFLKAYNVSKIALNHCMLQLILHIPLCFCVEKELLKKIFFKFDIMIVELALVKDVMEFVDLLH